MEDNKKVIVNNEDVPKDVAPEQPAQEVIKVEYSAFTKKLMDRDERRSDRKAAKAAASTTNDANQNQKPKWRKALGWIAAGAAATGAVAWAVVRSIAGQARSETDQTDPETATEETSGEQSGNEVTEVDS